MEPNREPYSFAKDPGVPMFEHCDHFTVMDAHCSLCAHGAKWIAKHDKRREFKIVPLQSEIGKALMVHYGLDPNDPISWLYIQNGIAHTSLDAFIRVRLQVGGTGRLLILLRFIPKALQDIMYRFVARNRYRFFGRTDMCELPDAEVKERLIG